MFNRDGLVTGQEPYQLFPVLELLAEDAPHAFYMGVELAKAGIALKLGKRYVQDEDLDWGVAVVPEPSEDLEVRAKAAHNLKSSNAESDPEYKPEGTTLSARKKKRKPR